MVNTQKQWFLWFFHAFKMSISAEVRIIQPSPIKISKFREERKNSNQINSNLCISIFFTTAFIIILYNILPYFKLSKVSYNILQAKFKSTIIIQFFYSSKVLFWICTCFLQLIVIHEWNWWEFYGTKKVIWKSRAFKQAYLNVFRNCL